LGGEDPKTLCLPQQHMLLLEYISSSGSASMPSFLNKANLQAITQACIDNGQYYDLFMQLRTLFLSHSINLTDETLQDMA